jgi:hypothetical protein
MWGEKPPRKKNRVWFGYAKSHGEKGLAEPNP